MSVAEKTVQAGELQRGGVATGSGSFRCAACGHAVTVVRALPACEQCSGSEWVATAWSPFSRARR